MVTPPWAHSANTRGQRHPLDVHLRAVAEAAREFGELFGAGEIAYWAGLWHDIGKMSPEFQEYLSRCEEGKPTRSTDHKAAGAILASRHLEPAALLIHAHHGGLRSPSDFKGWIGERRRTGTPDDLIPQALALIPDLEPDEQIALPDLTKDPLGAEFFLRMTFSALVDADFLDTEHHFSEDKAALRGSSVTLEQLWGRFERNHAELQQGASPGAVTDVRREVYNDCLEAADRPPGLFSLTVPTGGGKTLSSLAFALRHAMKNGQRRIIVVVPLLAITEQTTSVLRHVLGDVDDQDPIVLEHHSAAVDPGAQASDDFHSGSVRRRLAAENWDAPVIVTTTVQFFESLFGATTSKTRKLHRIANSVVILDEAQALPTKLLKPILDGLRELTTNYHTSVVLTTATQPDFGAVSTLAGAPISEIASEPGRLFELLRRVDYDWRMREPLPWTEVAGLVLEAKQVLAVVNTKKDAMRLLDEVDDPEALHLSTQLCGAHRRRVIEEIRCRLSEGRPCRLVSTQAVEAGVDLDFPVVLRALGPLHSIIQAAGRCNREGKLASGRMTVFRPQEGGIPGGSYRTATDLSARLEAEGKLDPHSIDRIRDYFRLLFQTVELDPHGIQESRKMLNYPRVAKDFRMIDDDTFSVVVLWGDAAEKHRTVAILDRLRGGNATERHLLRSLQPYLVSLHAREEAKLASQGAITPITQGMWEWHGEYDAVRGLVRGGTVGEVLIA